MVADSVSAENIALYLIDFREKIHFLAPNLSSQAYSDGRRHNSLIRMLKKQRTQLSNQLEKLLYQEFSPLMCYCRHGFPSWLLLMLNKYSSVDKMQKAGIAKLISIKGITKDKAIALLKKVENIEKKTSGHISAVIKSTSNQILALEESIKIEKKNLVQRFNQTDDVKLLTSVCGLGEQSAVEILIEIEDINRFEDAKKLSAYFGLHPVFKQSGDGKWGNHMSKKGRSEIRAVLFMSGMTAIRYSELFKRIYANARAKGKNHFNAMGVVMHKLLRVIFGVLKNRTPFNADTDAHNRDRATEKQRQLELEFKEAKKETAVKLDRYNNGSATASPISKRHSKKLKNNLPAIKKE